MSFIRDLRLGFRALMRAPGFGATVTLTLALSIAATTARLALFTIVNAVLLDPCVSAEALGRADNAERFLRSAATLTTPD